MEHVQQEVEREGEVSSVPDVTEARQGVELVEEVSSVQEVTEGR